MATGRDLVLTAIRAGTPERVPWVPFVGSHGGALLGIGADAYLKSADHLVAGLERARDLYRPDGLPVCFDLQIEAEILGCDLHWTADGPPSVTSHPLAGEATWDRLPAFSCQAGRMPAVLEATRRARATFGDQVALYSLLCGPFTLAMHLRGQDIFMDMFDDEDAIRALLDRCAEVAIAVVDASLDAGADVIAVVDPMLSQIGPEHLESLVLPALDRVFNHVRERGAVSSLFVCGDASPNLEVMCRSRCDNISIDENVDLAALRALADRHGKSIGGNIRLTTVLLMGDEAAARTDAIRCLDAGGATGFLLAPGCDLPYAVPAANVAAAGDMARDAYQREVARAATSAAPSDDFADITPPDYASQAEVVVDVITLDSASCPPCTYMVQAVAGAAEALPGKVRYHEHKITGRDGLAYMTHLGVGHIPTICIDGQVAFSSRIPDRRTLVARLEQALAAKGSP